MSQCRTRFPVLAVILFLALATTVDADPIDNFVAAYSDSLGLVTSSPVSLPDLTNGGSVVLGTLPIVGSSQPSQTPINGTFNLQIGWAFGSSQTPMHLPGIDPLLSIFGTFSGSVSGPSQGSAGYTGGYTSSLLSIEFPGPANLVNDYPDLNALWLHSERIHITGSVIQGPSGQNLLQTTLTIDPPEFVIPGSPSGGWQSIPWQPIPSPGAIELAGLLSSGRRARRPPFAKAAQLHGPSSVIAGRRCVISRRYARPRSRTAVVAIRSACNERPRGRARLGGGDRPSRSPDTRWRRRQSRNPTALERPPPR